ncbi:MAG: pilus assembly PilX N-terminal domain-containing protein, partial [Acidobacteria bacterium]|nr:pilus assembly PilX N-terminal domain-containing protein [Acidobacteriota bacterium]
MGAVSAQLESGPLTAGARRRRSELGVAAVIAIMALLLMTALGVAINLTVTSETMIAGNFHASAEAFYAADAVGERAIDDLRTVSD